MAEDKELLAIVGLLCLVQRNSLLLTWWKWRGTSDYTPLRHVTTPGQWPLQASRQGSIIHILTAHSHQHWSPWTLTSITERKERAAATHYHLPSDPLSAATTTITTSSSPPWSSLRRDDTSRPTWIVDSWLGGCAGWGWVDVIYMAASSNGAVPQVFY